ncbi:MAG TPA: SAM-dependent methyltransferase [Bacillota bacterium]
MTADHELGQVIAEEIAANGPMTFARYMELCLYHPALGYYRRPDLNIGKAGDFYTSPQVGAIFGRTLARQAEDVWSAAGKPGQFWVVEYGAGTGALAADLIEALAGSPAGPALRYLIIETSERLREVQAATIAGVRGGGGDRQGRGGESLHRIPVTWAPDLGPVERAPACVIANELVDAFPVHVVRGKGRGGRGGRDARGTPGDLEELYVTDGKDGLTFQSGPPSRPELASYFKWLGVRLADGQQAEANLQALDWLEELDDGLTRGAALVIDYGYLSPSLYDPDFRFDGTVMTYHRHRADPDPFQSPGDRDITAHVNFSALGKRANELGWTVAGYADQLHFLVNLGILDAISADPGGGPSPEARAAKQLIMPGGMGERFKVLALCKGLGNPSLKGFGGILPGRAE